MIKTHKNRKIIEAVEMYFFMGASRILRLERVKMRGYENEEEGNAYSDTERKQLLPYQHVIRVRGGELKEYLTTCLAIKQPAEHD